MFLKGYPLNCKWCHNPEGIGFNPILAYCSNKCINCGQRIDLCPNTAHKMSGGKHIFDRNLCDSCGKCVQMCIGDALKLYGREITTEELLPILLEDKEFYLMSGGGVTLSGGECLCQADFCSDVLKRLKQENIHTAVDTSGFVSRDSIDKVKDYTDVFLYDIKAFDETVHHNCTGQNNEIIKNI